MKIARSTLVSTISLGIAVSTAAFSVGGPLLAGQAGMDSPARKKATATPVPFAPGNQSCAPNKIVLPDSVPTNTGVGATITLLKPTALALTFSTEIALPAGTANLDYSIDGGRLVPIGPEFFADDINFFVTRTALGITKPPFTGLIPAGTHTIRPFLTAFTGGAGPGAAFFRCFSAVP